MRTLCLSLLILSAAPAVAADPPELRDGDRVVLLGNTLIEREQRHGYWEAALTAAHPDKKITFRNLGWSGDTVWGEARARFGGQADGFKHLKQHVAALNPTLVIVAYGLNESFAGPAGLPKFEQGLNALLDTVAQTKARIVVLGVPRQEDLGRPLPDPAESNKNIQLYNGVLRKVAEKRGYPFVDLYELLSPEISKLTDNGIHLTEYGYWRTADVVARALGGRWQPSSGHIDVEGGPDGGVFAFELDALPAQLAPGAKSGDFRQVLTFTGLKPGKYELLIDGKLAAAGDAAAWAKGVSLTPGPEIEQAEQLRAAIIEKNQTYFHRWRPQNETYLFLFRKNEQGQNAKEIPEFDPYIEELERDIARLKVPMKHTYELRLAKEAGK